MKSKDHEIHIYSEFPLTFQGGGERIMSVLANYLTSCGKDATLFEPNNSKQVKRVSESDVRKGSDFNIVKKKFGKFHQFLGQLLPDPNDLDDRAISLIFVRRIPSKWYLKQINNKKSIVIFCLHGVALEKFRLTNPMIMAHQVVMRIAMRRLSKALDGNSNIFAQVLTPGIRDRLHNSGAALDHLFLIENGLDVSPYYAERNDDFFQIVFMGRQDDLQKGIRRLKLTIEKSYRMNGEIRFVVMGSGKDSVILNGLPPTAKYLGYVDEETKRNELKKSNLIIITSNLEPYPLTLIEGLLCGLPAVSTPSSGPSYIISKEKSFGKISTFRPGDLAIDLLKYYNLWKENKGAYYELKKSISERAKSLFNEDSMLGKYLDMVEMVGNNDVPKQQGSETNRRGEKFPT